MSDDLISRKSLLENLNSFAPEHYSALVNDLIVKEPVAFDKEKVIEQIRERVSDCYLEYCGKYNNCLQCRSDEAVKIVEKGGIE